jgi:glycosyltransferase involved in cell wall biosynthesis
MHPEDYFHFPQRARKEAGFLYESALPTSILDEIEKNACVDYLLAGSEFVRNSYVARGFPADKAFTCHYGVDTSRFPAITRPSPQGRSFRLGAIGLIGFRKGIFRLLRVADWAKRRGIPLEIWFAGPIEDSEVAELISRFDVSLRFFGTLRGQEFQNFIEAIDAVAVFSYEEGLPIAMLEAMSRSLPAFVSTDTGACEVPRSMIEGVHIPDFEDASLDCILRPVLKNPAQVLEMGAKATARIQSGFSKEHFILRASRILEQIRNSRGTHNPEHRAIIANS